MKIIFICGSLEPGRDGVGDYVRRLAGELIRLEHTVSAIALNDRHIPSEFDGKQNADGLDLPVLRLPSILPINIRFEKARQWIDSFNPEWLSLQYVPYSFNQYGIPILLGKKLKNIHSTAYWHIMVHEPYIEYLQKKIKNNVTRALQKLCLVLIKKNLKPAIFHTTIPQYQQLLLRINIKSKILGLFGNIEITQLKQQAVCIYNSERNDVIAIYFGSAPSVQNHSIFSKHLIDYHKKHQRSIKLILCGKLGKYGNQFINTLQKTRVEVPCEVVILGELPAGELSKLFLVADFGIARTSPKFLGKSGSVISMLEHGLPVWVPLANNGEQMKEHLTFRPELCFKTLDNLMNFHNKRQVYNRLPEIASNLLIELSS